MMAKTHRDLRGKKPGALAYTVVLRKKIGVNVMRSSPAWFLSCTRR
jgi:hypothetical protein